MDKTYAETVGEVPFDWNLFLADPPLADTREHLEACTRAQYWTTCACGNQCAIIPRENTDAVGSSRRGSPSDGTLNGLGHQFYRFICGANWRDARTTLAAIEARSAVLIREELAKLNATPSPSLPMLVPFVARERL